MRKRLPLLSLALLALAACDSDPWVVEAEAALPPPPVYQAWFAQVGACMGQPELATESSFLEIRWYQGLSIEHPDRGRALGLWTEPDRITIRSDQLTDETVVKHELVHHLLQDPRHPPPWFERCAGR